MTPLPRAGTAIATGRVNGDQPGVTGRSPFVVHLTIQRPVFGPGRRFTKECSDGDFPR